MVETQSDTEWLAQELDESSFNDRRLGRRFRELMENFWKNIGSTIPFACQDWAGTKAAYRFLSNPHVDESAILQGHFESTRQRVATLKNETILLLQDTTTFIYQRDNPDIIGYTGTTSAWGKRKDKSKGKIVNCGILMHSSLAITSRGVPLGLSAIKFWTRRKFKGTNALKRKINPTRVPIEEKESIRWLDSLRQSITLLQCPERCVHVGDRESDIYELFCLSQELETSFLVRTCVDRLAGDGKHTISDEMENESVKCIHNVVLRDENEKSHEVMLSVRWKKILVKPPIGKSRQYPDITLFAIHAREENETPGRKPLEWKLLTNIPIVCNEDAIEKLEWYAHRWKIETFHKVLKSGCKAEDSKLRTAERLSKLISCFCIISWRIFWLTMVSREYSDIPAGIALTQAECELLDNVIKDNKKTENITPLQRYIIKLAQLGGYLARVNDPPPGNTVLWRGLRRLNDILYGFELSRE